MSWREILGVAEETYEHNPHNPHNSYESANSADIADIADRNSEIKSRLMYDLGKACNGLSVTPIEVKRGLAPVDIDDWCKGKLTPEALAAYARSLEQRKEMDKGKRPEHYKDKAICKGCGPVWLWFSGEVLGCPWCWNRAEGKSIPRPEEQ